jgi:hypothetical protein
MFSLHIDGDLFTVENGELVRFVTGKSDGWDAEVPDDTLLRSAPDYTLIAGSGERRAGVVYAYDRRNARIIALDKAEGTFIAQYRLAGGVGGWEDIRGFYVAPPIEDEGPPSLIWISRSSIHQAVLEEVPDEPPATPAPSGAPSGAPASAAPSTNP